MTNFINEIANMIGLPFETLFGAYRIINFNGKAVYIEGECNLISFGEQCVCITLGKKRAEIGGKNLHIKKMGADECVVCGEIANITVN